MRQTVLTATALALLAPAVPALAQEDAAPGDCFEVPDPVVSLSYGSRYTEKSEDRSDIDKESDAAVDEALGPIDDFVQALAQSANKALQGKEAERRAGCIFAALDSWAEAGAMSELETMNARISSPSRWGGMAMAYLQAKEVASVDPERQARIEDWLGALARASMQYFDAEAPPMASQNNLRAWAGYAVAAVGEATDDDMLRAWAAYSIAEVACQADDAGALPHEMSRGPRAMKYQLHATGALVVGAALLDDDGFAPFEMCDGALHRIAGFTPAAFEDNSLVEERAGEAQLMFSGEDDLQSFELAWAEAYLSLFDAPEIAAFVEDYRPLGNSKLGGSQSALW
ncbi:alginate lyase family protein [Roseivivax sp.]